ncbi:MAG: ABC transporter substrate-binding protein [Desulfohalobiaceae bacterium]|nr:ABC transporter substrate-binding protein [Desulfohalobiaceae bacterium]
MNQPARLVQGFVFFVLLLPLFLSTGWAKENETTLKIGISEEPRTLNIWLASDANSRKALSLIYQPLYTRNPDTMRITPWLAESMPVYDPREISYTVRLRPAKWADGSEVTADDVVFTVNLIQEFEVPRYYSKWDFVRKVEAVDKRTVKFYLKEPKAIFTTRTLVNYIVSRKEWEPLAEKAKTKEKPLTALVNTKVESPLGCGPFALEDWKEGTSLHFTRNEHFFGQNQTLAQRKLGPHVDKILFKIYGTADVAILALKKGNIDFLWWGIQPGYIPDLKKDEDVRVFLSEKSALYFMGYNVRKKPFSDRYLRQATAIVTDKDFFVKRVLQGYASRMDSIVPAENTFWHADDLPHYGQGLSRDERIKKATALLAENGYSWKTPPVDEDGNVGSPSDIILPSGQPMQKFVILTPPADYDPNRATCGLMIQEWLNDLGIPAIARPMSFGALLQKVKGEHDFDAFILGYGRLSLDPDYLRSFFHSRNDKSRGWNMSGYHNPEFDRLATKSVSAMDPDKRQELIHRMQEIVMRDLPYIPLYKPQEIEAANMKFSGWEQMVGGIGNLWSICQVKPNE